LAGSENEHFFVQLVKLIALTFFLASVFSGQGILSADSTRACPSGFFFCFGGFVIGFFFVFFFLWVFFFFFFFSFFL